MRASVKAYGSGPLSFAEFCELPANRKLPLDELRRKFAEADRDGSGLLDREELLRIALLDGLSAAELAWLEGSQGQQLGQIRVNPALMTGAILRERICRSSQLIALPEPQRFELFLGAPPLRMAPEHAIGVYCPPSKSTDDIQVQLCLQLGPAAPSPSPSAELAAVPQRATRHLRALRSVGTSRDEREVRFLRSVQRR